MLSGLAQSPADVPHYLTVMSQNLYLGADLNPLLIAAQTGGLLDIAEAVGQLWEDVQTRDFPARADAFADQIAHEQPYLIGLQEVSQFVVGGQTLDYLDILLEDLEVRGLDYEAVATTDEFGGTFPALVEGTFQNIQFTDRDVILARNDLPAPAMTVSNVQGGNFEASISFSFNGIDIPILRGWNSIDVQVWGQDFRMINTHLEVDNSLIPEFGLVQMAQASELVKAGGPADTTMPVIMVGDFNSRADGTGTGTYEILISAGFTDAWSETHPGDSGYTWSQNDDLRGVPATMNPPPEADPQRIDLALFRGDLTALSMDRLMEPVTPSDPIFGPLWPSDHTGIVATIGIQLAPSGKQLPWAIVNDDPLSPGEQALFVVGTDRSDTIYLKQIADDAMVVRMTRPRYRGIFHPTLGGRIYVHASIGNDFVSLSKKVDRDTMIFGGPGKDWVIGGRGNDLIDGGWGSDCLVGRWGHDILVGGQGWDILYGGSGRDFLIGGYGGDFLGGGSGQDILVAGTTAYDANDEALRRILDEWTSSRSYVSRVSNIRGAGIGEFNQRLNADYFLIANVTVFDDWSGDLLAGSQGRDWFFANHQRDDDGKRDGIFGRQIGEFFDDLDWLS
jgi:hypothetical protein